MFQSKEERLSALTKLIEKFSQNEEEYKKSDYKEAKLRTDFLNPFFEILDWDIRNESGKSEKYRDVIIEDRIEISGSRRAPDFCFRIGGQPKFYVEAKKPFVNIESEIAPSLQLRRYGHSAILPLSILTDFEEFAVYDTSIKPRKNDKASTARIMLIKYKDYVKEFDFLYETFSRGAIERGSFDKYAEGSKNKRGTDNIDKGLLELVANARRLLAKNISKLNEIGADYLNEAVIKIIDMTIFLKLAEDKGVENYEALLKAAQSDNLCVEVNKLFEAADERYNSGLFGEKLILKDINKEAPPSSQVKSLFIEPKILKEIIESFYFPECPYEFSVLPVSILGNIYEQFLGQTIRQTASGIIKIEEKPEVRKAGGVYYTPEYIVDYIIKNTVGEKIGGKTPKEIGAVKILDPACGSGSFLIRAYQFLLDYHLDYYQQPSRQAASLKQGLIKRFGVGSFRLSIPEKQRILTNNIFGVDIDAQAAETAKFSLLIKLMETETRESVDELFNPASIEGKKGMKVLPDLDGNIKCGNSLIDKDFYLSEFAFADNETIKKVNPFSWEETFPDIMKSGGFDCIVGNPPYLKERDNKNIFQPIMKSDYAKYHQGKMDMWHYFLHKAIELCKNNGMIGFITNSYWIKGAGSSKLIENVKNNLSFSKVVFFNDIKIFEGVSGKHMIHVYNKNISDSYCFCYDIDKNIFDGVIENQKPFKISNSKIKSGTFLNFSRNKIVFKTQFVLNDFFEVSQGIVEATDKVSKKSFKKHKSPDVKIGDGVFVLNAEELKKIKINKTERQVIKKYLNTNNVFKYAVNFSNEYLIYSDEIARNKIKKGVFPNLKRHLDKMKKYITSSNAPYGIHRPRQMKFFESEKLICKGMFKRPEFAFDNSGFYAGMSFSLIIRKGNSDISLKVLLALLNSTLAAFWFSENGKKRGVGVDIGVDVFRKFPIPKIDGREKEVAQIIKLVNLMIEIQKELHLAQNPKDKEIYQTKADRLEKEIDAIVYDLYGLTEKEIAVIEKN